MYTVFGLMVAFYVCACMLLITVMMTTLIVVERKVLSLLQRSVGPNVLGYRGRLQFIADALKLLGKGLLVPAEANNLLMISLPSIVLALCYILWLNSVWDKPSVSMLGVEYNTAYMLMLAMLSILFSFGIMLIGFFSSNKYCLIAAMVGSVLVIGLDAVMGILILNMTVIYYSLCFTWFFVSQDYSLLFFGFLVILCLMIIIPWLKMNSYLLGLTEDDVTLMLRVSFFIWVTICFGSVLATL